MHCLTVTGFIIFNLNVNWPNVPSSWDLLQKNSLKKANYLLVSGRVSYEIVSKAFLAKIPVIVAVSACSSMAVDFAKEFGICLIGFTRDQKMTIYSNPSFLKK